LTADGWLPKLKEIIPSYGISLLDDNDLLQRIREDTAAVLKVESIEPASAPPSLRKAPASNPGAPRHVARV
jgi:malate dehydrogenase (quinone)